MMPKSSNMKESKESKKVEKEETNESVQGINYLVGERGKERERERRG